MPEPSAQEHTLSLPKRPLALWPLAGLLTAPGAESAVSITRDPLTVSLSFSSSTAGDTESLAWDIDGDSISEATIALSNSSSTTIVGTFQAEAGMGFRGSQSTIQPVEATEMVGSSNQFMVGREHFFSLTVGFSLIMSDFSSLAYSGGVARDYVGFRFERRSGSGATPTITTHYGVAEVSLGIDPAHNDALFFTIHQWAWEDDPDTAISVAELIPEPGTPALAVLALGSLARRRRRPA